MPRIDNIHPCHTGKKICINSRLGFVNISNGSVEVTGKTVVSHGYLKNFSAHLRWNPEDIHIYYIEIKENVYPGESFEIIFRK